VIGDITDLRGYGRYYGAEEKGFLFLKELLNLLKKPTFSKVEFLDTERKNGGGGLSLRTEVKFIN